MPTVGSIRRAETGDVFSVELNPAVGGGELPGNKIEISRLAGAIGADDGGQGATLEGAVYRVDRDVPAETDGHSVSLEHRMFGQGL